MLLLREFRHSDRDKIVMALNSPEVTRYLSARIPAPYTVSDADWWLETGCKQGLVRAIEIEGDFAGCISVEPGLHEQRFTGEVGYWLAQEYWHQGYATKALRQLLQLIEPGMFARLQATVFDKNASSSKVLQKCGFTLEAKLESALCKHDVFYDGLLFGRLV